MQIFHSKQVAMYWDLDTLQFPKDYNKVADVDAKDLDEAFELTNSITHPWILNPQVKTDNLQCRSTSIGDVIESEGKYFRCEMMGGKN